ncbi:MAG: c-type cytochrome, partial [Planctomycetales bacterium]
MLTMTICIPDTMFCMLSAAEKSDQTAELANINAILAQNCVSCHGPTKPKGDLRLDQLDRDVVNGSDAELWHEVLGQVAIGDMPPEKSTPLDADDRQALTRWIRGGLA